MTVEELIEKLKEYPQDYEVVWSDGMEEKEPNIIPDFRDEFILIEV